MENHETLMKDSAADGAAKVIAKGDIITTITTEKEAEEEKAEQEDTQMDAANMPEAAVTTPIRQDTKVNHCLNGLSAARTAFRVVKGTFWKADVIVLANKTQAVKKTCFLEAASTLSFKSFLRF